MHRSGTSAATRALQLLGVSLGDPELLMAPGPDNPAGYWENRLVRELDDTLLAELGGSWDRPPVLEPGWEHHRGLDPWREEAREALVTTFHAEKPDAWRAWKDPRLCLLLPFWRTVTPIATTVVLVREPTEVAASLATRNGLGPADAAVLWLRHLLCALEQDPGALVVDHGSLFTDLDRVLDRMTTHLDLPRPGPEVRERVREHLDPGLRHHTRDPSRADPFNPLIELAIEVWNDGDPRPDVLPARIGTAMRRGWLRAPGDDAALTVARARAVELEERLRRQRRRFEERARVAAEPS